MKTVLIIDENQKDIEEISAAIGDLAGEIRIASTGDEIEPELLRQPDVVILDISSQGLGGIGLQATVKQFAPSAFLWITYNQADSNWYSTAAENGADAGLLKPYNELILEQLRASLIDEEPLRLESEVVRLHENCSQLSLAGWRKIHAEISDETTVALVADFNNMLERAIKSITSNTSQRFLETEN